MNEIMWSVGFIGNTLLSLCGIPLLYDTIKNGAKTSNKFLLVWFLGEIFAISYAIYDKISWFIILNYGISIVLIISIFMIQTFKKEP